MTNYEKIMSEMTVDKMIDLITDDGLNACKYCALREKNVCGWHCNNGIELWLKQEVKDEAN